MVIEGVNQVKTGRQEMDKRIAGWHARYEVAAPDRTPVFKQGSNLRSNLTQWVIDSTWVRTLRTCAGQDPYMRVIDENLGAGLDPIPTERLLQHLAQSDLNLRSGWSQGFLNAYVEGTGVGKIVRRFDQRTVRDREGTDLVERTIVERPGLGLDILDLKDFWVANASISDINRQPWVAHRVWLRWDDIVRRQRDGIYTITKTQLKSLKALSKSRRAETGFGSDQTKADLDRADSSGWEPNDEYEVLETEWRYDCDGDGLEEECLLTVLADCPEFPLRAQKLPFWNGYRNYIVWRPLPRSNRFYGRSLAGIIQMLQDEADTRTNLELDASAFDVLSGLTPILSRGMKSTWEKHKWDFGKPLYVDIPEKFQTLRGTIGHDLNQSEVLLDRIYSMAEKASGVSETTVGKTAEGTKTAFEIQTVTQEGNIKFAEMINQIQDNNRELGFQTIEHAYQLYQEDETFAARLIRVCGEDPFANVSLAEIRQRFDVQPVGNTSNNNQDLASKKWGLLYQQFSQDPFVTANKEREWYLRNQYFSSVGMSKEAPLIIGTREEAKQMQAEAVMQQQLMQAASGMGAGYMLAKEIDPTREESQQDRPGKKNGQSKSPLGAVGG